MSLLPLFPLQMVLFPGMALPLHIFEPRYKEMIGELLAEKQSFGVVRALDDGIAEVGCAAEILEVVKTHEDGKLDIVTQGQRRFEVVQLNQERNFLRAEVIYFGDDTADVLPEDVSRLLELHSQAIQLLGADLEPPAAEEEEISFQLAGVMPFDLDFKQNLLGMRSERGRVKALLNYYEAILPNLKRAIQARKKSGGNGHVV